MTAPIITIVIPCYNEANRITKTIYDTYAYCKKNFHKFEIIIVDDGSTDGTLEIISNISTYLEEVKYTFYKPNKGKGHAVRTGVLTASYCPVLFMDADNATRINMIERFLPDLYKYDLMVGSRNLRDSNIIIKQPLMRQIMGKTFSYLVRLIIGTKIKDTQCGFKLFCNTKSIDLFSSQTCDRFAFDVELIMNAEKRGLQIKEIPIDWYNDDRSKVNGLKDAINMFKDVIKIWKLKRINY